MSSSAQPVEEASVGELTARLSHDLSTLIRDELRLAQVAQIIAYLKTLK